MLAATLLIAEAFRFAHFTAAVGPVLERLAAERVASAPRRNRQSRSLWQITEAENSEKALAAVVKERPDLILMEIQLPRLDSYETMRRIRANPMSPLL
jgi:CheY-like chemotaxis protein